MAKKQRGQNGKFWNLYYHFKTIKHPMLRTKAMPSHSELLAAAAQLFGVNTAGISKREAIDLITPHLPGTGARAAAKRARAKQKVGASVQLGGALTTEQAAFIVSDTFLSSLEWRRVRYKAILRSDGCCEACGRGKPHGVVLNVDHIISRRKRPDLALVLSNLQILCHDCNHGKGNWDSTDWRGRAPAMTSEEREWERKAWERFE